MRELRMNTTQRRRLRSERKASSDARIVRRAIALLELDRGRAVSEVAEQVGVSRQTVYNWIDSFMAEGCLRSRPVDDGRGRLRQWNELTERLVLWSLEQRPDDLGFRSTLWTVPLLRLHIEQCAKVRLSEDTLRRRLHALGFVWKRPRYILEPDPEREKKRRIRRRIRMLQAGTVVLVQDETDLLLLQRASYPYPERPVPTSA